MKKTFLMLCFILFNCTSILYADTWYVKPDSTGEVINIQAGVDACEEGDTVLVALGVYRGDGNRDIVIEEKAIVIISEIGQYTTIISCGGSSVSPHWAFDLQSIANEGCVIKGFSITECFGFGIRCDSSRAVFENIKYYGNNDDDGGLVLPIMDCSYSDITITNNTFSGNKGKAIECSYTNMQISDCLFSEHTTYTVYSLEFLHESRVVMRRSQIIDNIDTYPWGEPIGGGGIKSSCSCFNMDSCLVSNNDGGWYGPACAFYGDTLIITNSQIINNIGGIGHCLRFWSANGFIQGTDIINNHSDLGSWNVTYSGDLNISHSVIARNPGFNIIGVYAQVTVQNSVLYHEYIDISEYAVGLDISESIIAFSGIFEGSYNSTESCCDVYEGGFSRLDSFQCNFIADPRFCDPENGVFTLQSDSPCLPGNHPNGCDCGLIGAYGLGCPDEEPYISVIEDVKNDQGRQVSIGWYRSKWDSAGSSQPISHYEVYRRIDELPIPCGDVTRDAPRGGTLYPPGDWHYLFDVPAHGEDVYYTVAPTLEDSCVYNDSTIAGEPPYFSTYFIRASTLVPTLYFDSEPDSGYSVDNLAPSVPEGFTVVYNAGAGRQLAWEACDETDFRYYKIYCGEREDFIPSDITLVHTCTGTSWLDTDDRGYWYHYYKISAVDYNGNESEATLPGSVTGDDVPQVPLTYGLYQNVPNPFNPATTIRFDLPHAVHAKLCVYNVKGELIATLVNQHMKEGRKAATWDGKGREGRAVSSGIYFYRLVADDFVQTKKMVLLR